MPRPVLTKKDFVRRYAAGEFGNASPTWENLEAWRHDSPWQRRPGDSYHIRNRVAGAPTWYDVCALRLPAMWTMAKRRCGARSLYISAMAPTLCTLLQGEVMRTPGYLTLYYTTVAQPMRAALAVWARTVQGILALRLLQQHLCPRSYAWLWHLLDAYDNHVVEFSTYSIEWGTLSGYNTVFWEVRRY